MKRSDHKDIISDWDWEKIATDYTDDKYGSVICIGGERSLNQYINESHQRAVWNYALGMKIEYYLDAGCGNGRFLKQGQNLSTVCVGLDFSSKMLQAGKDNTNAADFIRGDLTALPLKENTFDFLTCIITLKLLPPETRFVNCVAELVRVLKEGGKIAIIEDVKAKKFESSGVIIHTSDQIIELFSRFSCDLKLTAGIRIAYPVRFYRMFTGIILKIFFRNRIRQGFDLSRRNRIIFLKEFYPLLYRIYSTGFSAVLFFNKAIDMAFAPKLLRFFATERLFIFEKK